MIIKNYKLICWLIWLIGVFFITVPYFFCSKITTIIKHPFIFLFGILFSSIPFAVLGIYTKKVLENKKLDSYYKNIKFSGVIGAFALTVLYAIWEFSTIIRSGFTFFWFLSFGTMIIGFLVGGLIYIAITKIRKKHSGS